MNLFKVGLLRIAVAGVKARYSQGARPAYAGVGVPMAYGVFPVSGRLEAPLVNGLVGLLLDASLATVLVGCAGEKVRSSFPYVSCQYWGSPVSQVS